MKKLFVFILVISVVFSVVACKGSSTGPMTAEEIMANTRKNYENAKSMSIQMNMLTESNSDLIPKIEVKIDMDIITEPLQYKAILESSFINLEAYGADGKSYVKNPLSDGWTVSDDEDSNFNLSLDMGVKMTDLDKKLVDMFEVAEEDGLYVLSLEGNTQEIIDSFSNMLGEPPVDGSSITNLKIVYKVEKEKFMVNLIQIVGEFESPEANGEKINLMVSLDTKIDNLNAIDSIEIPKEALDSE